MKRKFRYYLCQIVGWGLLLMPMWVIGPGMGWHIMMVTAGLLASHLLRSVIVRYRWLELPVKAALLRLMAGVILACLVAGSIRRMGVYLIDGTMGRNGILGIFADVFDYYLLLVPWTMIYYLYHYAERVYRESLKNGKLELRVREMEERSAIPSIFLSWRGK